MKYNNDFTEFAGLSGKEALVLDQWLDQYQLKQDLMSQDESHAEDSQVYCEIETDQLESAVSEFNKDLQVAQIRIWDSEMVKNKDVPPYFIILAEWDNDMWLVAPFSQLSLPANEGEMKTNLDIPFCDVIQCWNAKTVQTCLIERSWLVDSASPSIVQAARDLFLNQIFGDELPEEFDFLRGGPVLNPLDPRIIYLRENKAQYAPLFQKVQQLDFFRTQSRLVIFKPQQDEEIFQLAAADIKETIVQEFIAEIDQISCIVTLFIEPGEDLELTVSDVNENDFNGLNGYTVRNKDGVIISSIQNAGAFISAEKFDGTLLITKPDGYPITLKKKQD